MSGFLEIKRHRDDKERLKARFEGLGVEFVRDFLPGPVYEESEYSLKRLIFASELVFSDYGHINPDYVLFYVPDGNFRPPAVHRVTWTDEDGNPEIVKVGCSHDERTGSNISLYGTASSKKCSNCNAHWVCDSGD